ncbi:MAG: efflux RND transporter permease subunit [Akkermansiaceae bacterium]
MIRWFANNDYAANFLMVAILLAGAYALFFKTPTEVTPAYQINSVIIEIPFSGSTPKEVETKLIIPCENALSGLSDAKHIRSEARRNRGVITVEARDGADMNKLKTDIESRINGISTFPSESEKPDIKIPDTASWYEVISVIVSGDLSEKEILKVAQEVKNDLTALPAVSKCDIVGVRTGRINIEVKQETLQEYGLTIDTLSRAIQQNSLDLSAGLLRSNEASVFLRSTNQALSQKDFENIIISSANGAKVKLIDIATVKDTFDDEQKITRFNGKRAIIIEIGRQKEESALKISSQVHEYVENSVGKVPAGVTLNTWDDDSISLRGRISTLFWNLIQGCLLVFILLGVFLRLSIAFWVVIGIPVSFAGAFLLMPVFGITANIMSLFGFIIVLGLVVDDAIVTSEHIYTKLKSGMNPLQASVTGATEIAVPVTFGILTTMIAFVPLAYQTGRMGSLAQQIPYVVIPVLLFSLIESKLILPSHLKHIAVNRTGKGIITRIQQGATKLLERFVANIYQPSLRFCVRYRYITLSAFAALGLVCVGYLYSGAMGFQAAPTVDRYYIFARLHMEDDTTYEQTIDAVEHITTSAHTLKEKFTDGEGGPSLIGNIMSTAGGWPSWSHVSEDQGYVLVEILPPGKRKYPGPKNQVIADAWTKIVGDIPGSRSFSIKSENTNSASMNERDDIEIEIRSDDEASLSLATLEIENALESSDGVSKAYTNISSPRKEFQIKLLPSGRDLGLSQEDLARQVRRAFYGQEAQRIQRGDKNIQVMVRLPDETRKSLNTLDELQITLPNGAITTLSEVAEIIRGSSPPSITREDGLRAYRVSAIPESNEINISDIAQQITPQLNAITAEKSGTNWRFLGTLAEDAENKVRLWVTGGIMLFCLYALLAIPFKSLTQPIFVLLAIPFGVIGAILGHMIMGITPSYLSIFGIIALSGIVVNDALVMVDFTNQKRTHGANAYDAVITSGADRFRPIMLTSATTFAGLMPLIFERSIQAQFLIPMAVSVAFGILFATLITLFLIPCAYMATEDMKDGFRKLWRWYTKPFRSKTV